ncbi:hypothetical protein C0989_003314 [Termitomyces sp. Mn162]|nr:hypothetical protein C0989_003314 [Termitomyces sp. Mn162]
MVKHLHRKHATFPELAYSTSNTLSELKMNSKGQLQLGNLKEQIAALEQQNATLATSNCLLSPSIPLTPGVVPNLAHLCDKIAKLKKKGGIPVPRGSFGLGAPPIAENVPQKMHGELYGNHISGMQAASRIPGVGCARSPFDMGRIVSMPNLDVAYNGDLALHLTSSSTSRLLLSQKSPNSAKDMRLLEFSLEHGELPSKGAKKAGVELEKKERQGEMKGGEEREKQLVVKAKEEKKKHATMTKAHAKQEVSVSELKSIFCNPLLRSKSAQKWDKSADSEAHKEKSVTLSFHLLPELPFFQSTSTPLAMTPIPEKEVVPVDAMVQDAEIKFPVQTSPRSLWYFTSLKHFVSSSKTSLTSSSQP